MRKFRLYPEERHWWSFNDYGHVLDVVTQRKAKRVLEFGPGGSTLALIEGGATHIDTCEDDPKWEQTYRVRLERVYPTIVHLRRYVMNGPLSVPHVDQQRYDLALVDGPRTYLRPVVIDYCLQRCDAVLAPTEDWLGEDGKGDRRRPPHDRLIETACKALAEKHGKTLTVTETSGLSGAFALIC